MNASRMENVFIGISGLIGAGKSTLATALAKVLGTIFVPLVSKLILNNQTCLSTMSLWLTTSIWKIFMQIWQNMPSHFKCISSTSASSNNNKLSGRVKVVSKTALFTRTRYLQGCVPFMLLNEYNILEDAFGFWVDGGARLPNIYKVGVPSC